MPRMAEPSPPEIPTAGFIERALGAAGFQRIFALALSLAGIGFSLAIASLYFASYRAGGWPQSPNLSQVMDGAMRAVRIVLFLVAGGLGLYLALRGHRKVLARLLASSCAALSAGLAGFYLAQIVISAKPIRESDLIQFAAIMVVVVLLMSVWVFCTAKFVFFFPKPVKLLDFDPQAHYAHGRVRGKRQFAWRQLRSPQFVALAAGVALIAMLDLQAERLFSEIWSDATTYFLCWVPFAAISAKQGLLPEEDRRAIRWVVLGQAAWLAFFLFAILAVYALREAGAIAFPGWTDSERFSNAFFGFFFAGFVLILIATLAFSILYHGTLDPDLMLRRAWFLGAFGLISGVLFVLMERLLAGAIAGWLGISTVNALTVVAIFTAIFIFPLRSWLERALKDTADRWQSANALADGVRREAVIVFADLSGYTALTEKNEREALIMAAVFHRDAQTTARAHRGYLIKTIGDAAMLRFENADEAYGAAIELQRTFRAHIESMSLAPLSIHPRRDPSRRGGGRFGGRRVRRDCEPRRALAWGRWARRDRRERGRARPHVARRPRPFARREALQECRGAD